MAVKVLQCSVIYPWTKTTVRPVPGFSPILVTMLLSVEGVGSRRLWETFCLSWQISLFVEQRYWRIHFFFFFPTSWRRVCTPGWTESDRDLGDCIVYIIMRVFCTFKYRGKHLPILLGRSRVPLMTQGCDNLVEVDLSVTCQKAKRESLRILQLFLTNAESQKKYTPTHTATGDTNSSHWLLARFKHLPRPCWIFSSLI